MENFKILVNETGTKTAAMKINYIRTILRGEELQEFDGLASQNAGTNNAHMKFIQEGLLGYFFRLLPFSKKSVRCVVQCVNLETSLSSVFAPLSRN